MLDVQPHISLPTESAELIPVPAQTPLHGWEETFVMPLFRPGTRVRMGANVETVSHIVLRRQELLVHLVGREGAIHPSRIQLKPTVFTTRRRPESHSAQAAIPHQEAAA